MKSVMEIKCANNINKRGFYEKFWFSVLLNIAVLLVLVMLFKPGYDTNDDWGMCNIVNGSKGIIDGHVIFENYLLGLICAGLYQLTAAIPWYPVLQYCLLFSSYTAISYVLINKLKYHSSIWIVTALLVVFAYEGYINMQFTRTSGVATVAGLLLMFWVFDRENCFFNKGKAISIVQLAAGLVISVFGFMYRDSQFIANAALMSAVGFMLLLNMFTEKKGNAVKPAIAMACSFVILFGVAGGLTAFDKSAYRAEEWQEYRAYNVARSKLYDHGFPEYSEYASQYEKMGINENAKNYYRQWNHVDLDGRTMEQIGSFNKTESPSINGQYIKRFIITMAEGYAKKPLFYAFLAVIIMWIIWGRKNWISLIGIIYEAVIAVGLNFYMFWTLRYLKDRVDVGILLAAVIVIIWTFKNHKPLFSNKLGIIIVMIALVWTQYCWHDNWRTYMGERNAAMNENRKIAEKIARDKEHLYLNKAVGFSYSDAYDVFDVIPQGISENVFTLGGWTCGMPSNQEKLDRFAIKNVYEDSVNNDSVYIIDKDITTTIQYIQDYYCDEAKAEYVRNIETYPVYRLVK